MRKWIRLFILPFCVSAGLAAAQKVPAAPPITLENSELQVTLSPQDAMLLSVLKKQAKTSYLGSSKQPGWFRIQIPLRNWEGHAAASNDLRVINVQRRGPGAVVIEGNQLQSKDGTFLIPFKLTLRLEANNLVCQLSLKNQSKETIDRIAFPALGVPAAPDSKEALVMPQAALPLRSTFSENDVRTYHNPFDTADLLDNKAWFFEDPKISARAFNYPDTLATAWFTLTGGGRGVGFDVRDRQFQYQKLVIERRLYRDAVDREANRRDYEVSWNWYPLVRPGASWESSEVYIKFDDGDWHGIAGQHREWLKSWIRRPNVAKEFQSSLGWLSRGIRSYDEIPTIAKTGVDVGVPYFIVYGWAHGGAAEMFYDAYPREDLGGLKALQRNLLKARELGCHPLAWYNGTLSGSTRVEHLAQGKDWVVVDRWGGGILDGQWSLFGGVQPATVPNNENWLQLDPSGSKDALVDTVRRFVEDYHFSGFEMDQGYKFFLSYRDPSRIPPAVAYSKGYADFYTRAVELVKRNDPDGIIVAEGHQDFQNQYVDSSWIFEGGALDLSQLSRLRYSLPWVTVPVRAAIQNLGQANEAFMMNAPLSIFDDLTRHSDYGKHLKQLHILKQATSHYFYQGEFADGEGFSLAGSAPVVARSYRDPAGKFLAVVVVNTTGATQQATLKPEAAFATREARHYFLDGRMETHKASPEFPLELPAFDVQVLAFEML